MVGADTAVGGPPGAPDLSVDLDLDDEERRQLRNGVVRLRLPRRYAHGIAELAEAVRTGDADQAVHLLVERDDLHLTDAVEALRADVVRGGTELRAAAEAGDARRALELLGQHRLLCAHRTGPYGVAHWNREVARWTGEQGEWCPGRPVLVTRNDPETDLHNGDVGVVVTGPDGPRVAFARAGPPRLLAPSLLPDVEPVHALTVHRGQGSQYDAVTVVLPAPDSPLLTRQLLYTAVTRARQRVRLVGAADAVRAGVDRPLVRASGLRRVLGGGGTT